ncbi:hypothetical protein R3W88_032098 [Solanum pinnatisectum]|uniref:RNase H type-1 domain-containing protein n=1 Tax=Solanum pinnatisectum TaxID=50273 RepID=A0AAV9LN78_9SOLN|nr:hypothetical protein R3W88_032098 [Solanum pinnatisectum]
MILDIKSMLYTFEDSTIRHCYREVNNIANCLNNFGVQGNGYIMFDAFHQHPINAKGEYNMDRLGFPSFRTKPSKKFFALDKKVQSLYHFEVP